MWNSVLISHVTPLSSCEFSWKSAQGSPTISSSSELTLTLLTRRIWWAPNHFSRWQMGFNSAFEVLIFPVAFTVKPYNIPKIKNALFKSCVLRHTVWNLRVSSYVLQKWSPVIAVTKPETKLSHVATLLHEQSEMWKILVNLCPLWILSLVVALFVVSLRVRDRISLCLFMLETGFCCVSSC